VRKKEPSFKDGATCSRRSNNDVEGHHMRNRAVTKDVIRHRLRQEFPTDTVDVSDGYQNSIHVLVVSRKFDGLKEREKQEYLWGLIDSAGLEDA